MKKLDLSQISFKDVCFNIYKGSSFGLFSNLIDYRDTNAVINASEHDESFARCNFSGTKITGKIKKAYFSDFSNCQLTAENLSECISYYACDFSNNNLQGLNIGFNYLIGSTNEMDLEDRTYYSSNFRNTGVSFSGSSFAELFNEVRKRFDDLVSIEFEKEREKALRKQENFWNFLLKMD